MDTIFFVSWTLSIFLEWRYKHSRLPKRRTYYKNFATDEVGKEIVTEKHALRSGSYEVELINRYRHGVYVVLLPLNTEAEQRC